MVLAIALDHLAVGVEFEALVTRLAYPGSHAVSIDPLVDRVSDAVADGVISPARPFGGETPNASARELFLALISSDPPHMRHLYNYVWPEELQARQCARI